MAKKVKKKVEEDDDYRSFTFPHFDVPKFIHYELEQTSATAYAVIFAMLLAVLSWRMTVFGAGIGQGVDLSLVALMIGFVVMAIFPFFIRWAREKAGEYRMGDWASLLMIILFLWLGMWNLFLNV